jgi:predicted nucleic acid-binding Zn ribbon protein
VTGLRGAFAWPQRASRSCWPFDYRALFHLHPLAFLLRKNTILPSYLYQCDSERCGKCLTVRRAMDAADVSPRCTACLGSTHRILSTPYITTTTFLETPGNKDALAKMDANRKETDARYAKTWDR